MRKITRREWRIFLSTLSKFFGILKRLFQYEIPMHANLAVTWWNNSEWSEKKKCTFKGRVKTGSSNFSILEEGDEYVAYCDHLTDFALLIASHLYKTNQSYHF
jgi:hypothetical protein